MQLSLQQDQIVHIEVPETIADDVMSPGIHTFEIMRRHVARNSGVTDTQILEAMDWLFRYQKQVVEPGGACALTALLCGEVQPVGQHLLESFFVAAIFHLSGLPIYFNRGTVE